jgi:hypothetical protein
MAPRRAAMVHPMGSANNNRQADNELYDRACDLLLAAQELRTATAQPDAALALAASVGCLEETLAAMADSAAQLDALSWAEQLRDSDEPRAGTRPLDDLAQALHASRRLCASARNALVLRAAGS